MPIFAASHLDIRPFEPSDATSLCGLFNRTGFNVARFGVMLTADDLLRGLAECGVLSVVVAVDPAGRVVGTVWFMPAVAGVRARPGGIFTENYLVEPRYRLTSLGAALIVRAGIEAMALGHRRLDLPVLAENKKAIRLYRRAGFKVVDPRPNENGVIVMESHLPGLVADLLERDLVGPEAVESLMRSPAGMLSSVQRARRRADGSDLTRRNGREVLVYSFGEGADALSVTVDRDGDRVVAIDRVGAAISVVSGDARSDEGPASTWSISDRSMTVDINSRTGSAEVHASDGPPLAQLLWPEIGPPFPACPVTPMERRLEVRHHRTGELALATTGNPWHDRFGDTWDSPRERLADIVVERTVSLAGGRLVISTRVDNRGETTLHDAAVRTFDRSLLVESSIVVPLRTGLVNERVDPRFFPFTLADAEYLKASGLPTEPSEYAGPWSAFQSGDRVVGLVWPQATEVRFGGRWLPSALYAIERLEPGESVCWTAVLVVARTPDDVARVASTTGRA